MGISLYTQKEREKGGERVMELCEQERIVRLSDAFGPSGFEDDVIRYATTQIQDVCEVKEDHMRNLYMNIKQERNDGGVHILLDAHSDEVGFITQAIRPDGTLRFLPLGGWDAKNIIAGKVWIKNTLGERISGVVCSKPVHFMNEQEKARGIGFDDLLIDVGSQSAQETMETFHIHIGSPIVPATVCAYDEQHAIFMGKAFDCRIGCAALLQTLLEIAEKKPTNNVCATLSSQEEVGERGMKCAIQNVKPDLVICFEGCPADDTFEESYMVQSALKKGPMLRHFDRSMITNPRFQRYALEVAKKQGIPVQESVRKGGGTNGGITHTAFYGIPTIIIGIPVRFAHSPCGITSFSDYRHAIELAKCLIMEVNKETVQSF